MLDFLIWRATVIDGSGSPGIVRDVGIRAGKIALDGKVAASTRIIDANNMVLTPGFIDVHGHSDLFAFLDPLRASKLCQGITTEIGGQCGISPAPISSEFFEQYSAYYKNLGVPLYPEAKGLTSVGALFDTLESLELGINLALFTAHGSLRIAAMGLDPKPADHKQLGVMQAMAKEAFGAGSLGISTGMMYAPGSFTPQKELAALCSALSGCDALYTSHIRNQGNCLVESVREALEIASCAGLGANISHHKAVGRDNWGKVKMTTMMIHEVGASHDVYPYEASSTTLTATLPPSYLRLGMERLLKDLQDSAFRDQLEHDIFHPTEAWDNDLLECGYDGILIISAPATGEALGSTIANYADTLQIRPFDAYIKLLSENRGAVSDVCFSMSDDDVDYLVTDRECMFGTDSLYVPRLVPMTHPRAIGTFPKILGTYVRDRKLLSLEEAVRKMTSLAATRYQLKGKGYIREGFDADLVLFDPLSVGAPGTYDEPLLPNTGIKYVFVNGLLAVENGIATGNRGGHVIRHGV